MQSNVIVFLPRILRILELLRIATFQGLRKAPFFEPKDTSSMSLMQQISPIQRWNPFSSFRIGLWETWLSLIVPGTYELPFDSVHTQHHTSTHTTSNYRRDIAMCRLEKLPKNPKSMLIPTTKSIFCSSTTAHPEQTQYKAFVQTDVTRMSYQNVVITILCSSRASDDHCDVLFNCTVKWLFLYICYSMGNIDDFNIIISHSPYSVLHHCKSQNKQGHPENSKITSHHMTSLYTSHVTYTEVLTYWRVTDSALYSSDYLTRARNERTCFDSSDDHCACDMDMCVRSFTLS